MISLYLVLNALAGALALAAAVVAFAVRKTPGHRGGSAEGALGVLAAAYAGAELVSAALPSLELAASAVQLLLAGFGAVGFYIRAESLEERPFRAGFVWSGRGLVFAILALSLLGLIPGVSIEGPPRPITLAGQVVARIGSFTAMGLLTLTLASLALVPATYRALNAARAGVPGAGRWAAALVVMLPACINDIALVLGAPTLPLVSIWIAVPSVLVVAFVVRRGVKHARNLDLLRQQLEDRVSAERGRTAEHERELAALRGRLREAERLATVGRVSAGVAHEINNPTAAVMANVSFVRRALRGHVDSAQVAHDVDDALADAEEALERSARIVQQLLDVSRAQKNEARREPVAFDDVLRRAVGTVRAAERDACSIATTGDLGVWAVGDADRLVQVITNLVTNAVHAVAALAPDARATRHVRVEVEQGDDERVCVRVADDGIGMDAATLARVREPFFTTKPRGQGTGLGLALVENLVQSMGASLEIESEPGVGTTMSFWLPSAAAPRPSQVDAFNSEKLPPLRMLVVDDDPHVLNAYGRMLRRYGLVRLCDHVDSALAATAEEDFDAIVCDVIMPDGGGQRVLESLSERMRDRLVFVTGGAGNPDVRTFLGQQPRPVLYKPISRDDLLAQIDQLVDHRISLRPAPIS